MPASASAILVLDTTGRWCAAGLKRADGQVFTRHEAMARGQAERLALLVEELLTEAGVVPREIARIGVATGPGSFAGTRAGTAFARGLALATDAQALGVSSLAAWAHQADPGQTRTVAAIHDARRGEAVLQVFTLGEPVSEILRLSIDDARAALAEYGDVVLTGSGAALLGADPAGFADEAPLAALMALTGMADEDAPPPSPRYARPPDAALPGGIIP
ncbi:MAG: tRNA (adenosine(37)-N6)-threonylcarbamoyltransferase complex dimerization subunit type 1 TsaB [Oceanicaulis sp.]|uniref:tRNA (adenosine(37)-N6)-threonylcarbamoyltransferase complex dimerization subunit type 1 TsaB n=1 Tax=Glycocaulis sp. TaxID=1969725 RepID=UPI0025C171C1|nr:tRNA (adenosine(37)-N6)-threonylcarbamoyltransferase complex dimerization subunit type 1 TsaB [Glycocaulis sp.]MCC5980949.1 tRNA (adenosine(37)-N6)-threonylcarbamoyltransferase complex dimerization subunit type 1 TsaB [Oceanicaulis sp.]MCH8522278.1 tRNA (adenosine(37)-N6)-threonylcarbamoyltransferase complex dimerization subunit type 1 TsaB [Glycocaulis sp.]